MNLADRGELTGFLRKHGISADKSLGQHFLCSPNVVNSIVSACGNFQGCLEVGPGPGILTSALAKSAQELVAIEFDARMLPLLKESTPSCKIIHGDALIEDIGSIMRSLPEPRVLVSNMPYYITGPLLDRFSQARNSYECAVLMMQKEVGQKILAQPRDRARGALSVCLQFEFQISSICKVPPGSFMPPPKVESIVLKLVPRTQNVSDAFRKTVRAGFGQPRKTLINNFVATFRHERSDVVSLLDACGFGESTRAFELNESEWMRIVDKTVELGWVN